MLFELKVRLFIIWYAIPLQLNNWNDSTDDDSYDCAKNKCIDLLEQIIDNSSRTILTHTTTMITAYGSLWMWIKLQFV